MEDKNNTLLLRYAPRWSLGFFFLWVWGSVFLQGCTATTTAQYPLPPPLAEEKTYKIQAGQEETIPLQGDIALVYRFEATVTTPSLYAFETQGAVASVCSLVELVEKEERYLTVKDEGGEGENCRILWALPAGTHIFKARVDGKGSFRVALRRVAWGKEIAVTMPIGQHAIGEIEAPEDQHRFRFRLASSRMIQLHAQGSGNLQCILQDQTGRWLQRPDFRHPYGSCTVGMRLQAGDYFFTIRSDQPKTAYKLKYQKIRLLPLATGQIREGYLLEETFDLYRVTLTEGRFHRIQGHGKLPLHCTLEDQLGHIVIQPTPPQSACLLEGFYPPGAYYLRVRASDTKQQGRYQISFEERALTALQAPSERIVRPAFDEAYQVYRLQIQEAGQYQMMVQQRGVRCLLQDAQGKTPSLMDLSEERQCHFYANLPSGSYLLTIYPLERSEDPYRIQIMPYSMNDSDQLLDRSPRLIGPVSPGYKRTYQIKIDSPQMVTFETRGDLDTYCELFEQGRKIAYNDDGDAAQKWNCRIDRFLLPGLYTFHVEIRSRRSGYFWLYRKQLAIPKLPFHQPLLEYVKDIRKPKRYLLTLKEKTILGVRTEGSLDTHCVLFNIEGQKIVEDDDSGSESNCMLTRILPPGTYSLQITSHRRTGSYQLHASTLQAPELIPLQGRDDTINPPYRTRFYKITIPKTAHYTARTYGSQDTTCHLFNAQGQLIHQNDDLSNQDKNCQIAEILQAGIYYLQIRPKRATQAASAA